MNGKMLSAVSLTVLLLGCGGNSSRNSQATAAPVASTAPTALAFRTLDRGDQTGVVTSGSIAATSTRIAASNIEWVALWNEHQSQRTTPTPPLPAVDMTRETVVGLFLGQRPSAGHGIEVVGVAEVTSAGTTTVEVSYVTHAPVGPAGSVVTSPFHLVAVNRANAQLSFHDVTPAPVSTPIQDVHGELVAVPSRAGGTTLAFQADGAQTPLEISDPSALTAARAHEGFSLVVSGDVAPNQAGLTTLSEVVRISAFDLDELAISGSVLVDRGGARVLRTPRGNYDPLGPLATPLLATPVGQPLRVTGRIDPNHSGTLPGLIVTSWRPAVQISWSYLTPLLGSERFSVEDLASGAYIAESVGRMPTRRGEGRWLPTAELVDLRAKLTAANLPSQPRTFRPAQVYPDHPFTTLRHTDAAGQVTITIYAGAQVPAELDALVVKLRTLRGTVPTFRTIEVGTQSGIQTAATEVARDQAAWSSLWTRHKAPARPVAPATVDFSKDLVLGVFDGFKPTGGFTLEVANLERIGPHLHVTLRRTTPSGPAPSVLTFPFHLVVVPNAGDLYVDGVKQP